MDLSYDDYDMEGDFEPSLASIIAQDSLRWVFVGGKGGVGKSSTAASLSVRFARTYPQKRVLIVSTDPAHNVSDAFCQKVNNDPTAIDGFDNLWGMEVSAPAIIAELKAKQQERKAAAETEPATGPLGELMSVFDVFSLLGGKSGGSVPGLDEVLSMQRIQGIVRDQSFDLVVLDTAPTGHTLRLLSLPETAESLVGMLRTFEKSAGSLMAPLAGLMGGDPSAMFGEAIGTAIKSLESVVEVGRQFRNAELTTFVCVLLAEFLPVMETERLVQSLMRFEIDCHALVVNQVLPTPTGDHQCALCAARSRMQAKYLAQIEELYPDFHVVRMPLCPAEIRGLDQLTAFGEMLVTPHDFSQ
jgi:arsenite-transporting ATPase